MDLSGETLSAKFSSTTLRTLVKVRRLCLMSSSVLAADAPEMLGPNIPPAMEQRKMTAGAIQKERRFEAKGLQPPSIEYRHSASSGQRETRLSIVRRDRAGKGSEMWL